MGQICCPPKKLPSYVDSDRITSAIFGGINLLLQLVYIGLVIWTQVEETKTKPYGVMEVVTYLFPLWQITDIVLMTIGFCNPTIGAHFRIYFWVSIFCHNCIFVFSILVCLLVSIFGASGSYVTLFTKYPLGTLLLIISNTVCEVGMLFFYLKYFPDPSSRLYYKKVMILPYSLPSLNQVQFHYAQ